MVIRFDAERVKSVANRVVEPIGVDGDPPTNIGRGVSEAEKIVEGARKSMANAGISDDPETAEKATEEILQRMSDDEPGPELSVNEHSDTTIADQALNTNSNSQGSKPPNSS